MKLFARLALMAVTPLLMAAIWMDRQPGYRPYQSPVLTPPAGSVPVSGREIIPEQAVLKNPLTSIPASLALGKKLFEINCAMCHGQTSREPGPVGKKFKPPPPGLDHELVQGLSDNDIFRAITTGFGRMPPFQDKLMPDERWHLVNFLRTRQ